MRRIATHKSSDLDAISSVWLIKRFYPNWDGAEIAFVNAGEKLAGKYEKEGEAIEIIDGVETMTVDTGLGPLDHHQTSDQETCGAKRTLDFILGNPESNLHKHEVKKEAVMRLVDLVIDDDHFQEVYYPNAQHDSYFLGLVSLIQGYKLMFQKDDLRLVNFVMEALDAILHNFETIIWAEKEIKEKGVEFETQWGKAIGVETINDEILKLAQMMGYVLSVRKDPDTGVVRIKALPNARQKNSNLASNIPFDQEKVKTIDLTPYYEKIKMLDKDASWFLHASKRLLLNGSSKNPDMKGTSLTLEQVIDVLKV